MIALEREKTRLRALAREQANEVVKVDHEKERLR